VWVSFDDGDTWQSLQLNLPVTSMRDFEIHGDDLVLATHGRGFWVIDDISVLRQVNAPVAAANAHLFKNADAIAWIQVGDNGTPTQKDEPQLPNPPDGAIIDYYLRTNATSVTIEIINAGGTVVGTLSNQAGAADAGAGGGRGGAAGGAAGPAGAFPPNTTTLWRPTPEPFPTSAGQHRVVWSLGGGGRGGRGGGGGPATGTFTARLTVDGQTYTQPLTIKPDPRR
jgi:hypothetical protein